MPYEPSLNRERLLQRTGAKLAQATTIDGIGTIAREAVRDLTGQLPGREALFAMRKADELTVVATGAIHAFEALVRWPHPVRRTAPPSEFIELAEEAGLIIPLGSWILKQAITDMARWRGTDPDPRKAKICINVSRTRLRPRSSPRASRLRSSAPCWLRSAAGSVRETCWRRP
jgi:hypothetical protein